MSKHTPGPWEVDPHDRYDKWIGVGGDRELARAYNDDIDSDEAEANARLIAAAPELLAGLEHMRSCGPCAEDNWEMCEGGRAALAAIAKATGESK